MANPEHLRVALQGITALQQLVVRTNQVIDLSHADLAGLILEGGSLNAANFAGANLTDATLKGVGLIEADFTGAQLINADLSGCNFTNAKFTEATLQNCKCVGTNFQRVNVASATRCEGDFAQADLSYCILPQTFFENNCTGANLSFVDLNTFNLPKKDFTRCNFTNSILTDATLDNATLSHAQMGDCKLQGADLTSAVCEFTNFLRADLTKANLSSSSLKYAAFFEAQLEGANIKDANFLEATLDEAKMANLIGARSAKNLLTTRINSDRQVYYFESAIRSFIDRRADWQLVRVFGRLPLFGSSYSALVSIPLFFYLLEIYNDKVRILKEWALTQTDNQYLSKIILKKLHELPYPELSKLLLISTISLAMAATIYALACPSRIKEFSLDQWKYQLGLSAVHYLPDAWGRKFWRLVALCLYGAGSVGVLVVLLSKLWGVGVLLLG